MHEAKSRDDTRPGRHPHRIGLVAAGAIALLILATGCAEGPAGPGVAGAGPSSSPEASPSSDPGAEALAFSRCVRAHGVPDFPDPDANGAVNNPQLTEASGVIAQAQEACSRYLPEGNSGDGGSANAGDKEESLLAYSQCMRDHGITGFPDPKYSDGQWGIPKNGKYDPLDPAVERADAACLRSMKGAGNSKK